jgi:hypothetical protein
LMQNGNAPFLSFSNPFVGFSGFFDILLYQYKAVKLCFILLFSTIIIKNEENLFMNCLHSSVVDTNIFL